jgi:hypothetical protein
MYARRVAAIKCKCSEREDPAPQTKKKGLHASCLLVARTRRETDLLFVAGVPNSVSDTPSGGALRGEEGARGVKWRGGGGGGGLRTKLFFKS